MSGLMTFSRAINLPPMMPVFFCGGSYTETVSFSGNLHRYTHHTPQPQNLSHHAVPTIALPGPHQHATGHCQNRPDRLPLTHHDTENLRTASTGDGLTNTASNRRTTSAYFVSLLTSFLGTLGTKWYTEPSESSSVP